VKEKARAKELELKTKEFEAILLAEESKIIMADLTVLKSLFSYLFALLRSKNKPNRLNLRANSCCVKIGHPDNCTLQPIWTAHIREPTKINQTE
jgi:hypothetical protein